MRQIGLHIRVEKSIIEAAVYAERLNIPIFQSFLINQSDRRPLPIDDQIAAAFKELCNGRIFYVHGSYWINLAQTKQHGLSVLRSEINTAKRLGSHHLIFHPGSALATNSRQEGIDTVARAVNSIMKEDPTINIILENTVHAQKTIGSNFEDFYHIKQKIEYPERLGFCIDTAHAHAYGYNISSLSTQKSFLDLVDQTIGISSVVLIHLNDAEYQLSSRIDKHAPLGQGSIGIAALQSFAINPRLIKIPIILELPALPIEVDNDMLEKVRSWHQ